ncbi:endonuclease domain-containing protein [Allorhizocola rhizosphaerae]|uniref:endonuclease domain-containing protein n=1 Tax=Allorhizocola rhizosphaerae TaxID=1872709 RepID=UPI0013C36BD6|nr:endonuclease domain-containing protein [Allorhizocola rhizosphaerae]
MSPRRKYERGSYWQTCFNERSKKSHRKRMLEKHGREARVPFKASEGHRRCPDCDTVKPLEEFPLNKAKPSGYDRYCLRGILCLNCNTGLGHYKDNIANMRKAIAYLEETSWQRVLVQPGVYRLRSPRRACLPSRNS